MTADIPEELQAMRAQIDVLDEALIDILAQRFEVVHEVGDLKLRKNMDAVQPKRAQAVQDRAAVWAEEKGLDPQLARTVFKAIIDHAHALEFKILGDDPDEANIDEAAI